jgi:uncharacterized protein YndB with AHSA1/START domain
VTADVVQVEVRIQAPADLVFSYFTDPTRYVQWMGRSAVIEPWRGGRYYVLVRPGVDAIGEFVVVDPPHRLVFTWGSDAQQIPISATTVEVTFTQEADGTLVRLRHYGIDRAEQRAKNTGGWTIYLTRLAGVAEGRNPGLDPFHQDQDGEDGRAPARRLAPMPSVTGRGPIVPSGVPPY